MSDALQRLINKTRPFKDFTLDLGDGEVEAYKVRRTNVAENETISQAYVEAYDRKIRALQDEDSTDYSVLHRNLAQQRPEDLAKYLVDASREDVTNDVLDLYDGQEVTAETPEVAAKIEKHLIELEEEFKQKPIEELTVMALEKREHFIAILDANMVRMRHIAAASIYTAEGEKLFPDVESVKALDEATLTKLVRCATEALNPSAAEAEASQTPLE